MNEGEFIELVRSTLVLKRIEPEDGMGVTRGWDSLKQVSLALRLGEELGIPVPPDRIGELSTLQSLLSFFREKGAVA